MALSCCEKFICITQRNYSKPCWRLLQFKLFSFIQHRRKTQKKKHENVCNDHHYGYVEIPNKHKKIIKYNHGEKSLKAPFMIYADFECLLEKMPSCQNNPEKSYTEKKTKHIPSDYLLFNNCSFDEARNKYKQVVTEAKPVWKGFVRS